MVAVIHPLLCTSAFQKTGLGREWFRFTPEIESVVRELIARNEASPASSDSQFTLSAMTLIGNVSMGQEAQSIVKTST
jgi:hypothetical protein